MKIHFLVATSSLMLLLVGCDFGRDAEGIVLDRATHRPLALVQYQVLRRGPMDSSFTATDSVGHFYVSILCDSPDEDLVIRFSKAGYDTLVVRNTPDSVFYLTPHL